MIFHLTFPEQRELLPLELPMEGGLSVILIWPPLRIFSWMGELLHRALLIGFWSMKTLAFDNSHLSFKARGSSLPFAVDRCHASSP